MCATRVNICRIESSDSVYEIFKSNILGAGAYSTVYLGRCISKNKKRSDGLVAIKKIDTNKVTINKAKKISAEISVIEQMMNYDHENIVSYYDIVYDDNIIYIVMEYCQNSDLSSLLIGIPMKEIYVKYYFSQVINAMKFINNNEIMHRDIKPKNLLLSNNRKTLKLCDFGLAKNIKGLPRVVTMCGSPLYMAPEIYGNDGYTTSVDVWSLGIILFEMLFGFHPLEKYNDITILTHHIRTMDIVIPNNILNISNECINLLARMLKRNECDRIKLEDLFKHTWITQGCNIDEIENIYEMCIDINSCDVNHKNLYVNYEC